MSTVHAFVSGIANQEDRLPSDTVKLTIDQARDLVVHASNLLATLGDSERRIAWLLEEAVDLLDRDEGLLKLPANFAY